MDVGTDARYGARLVVQSQLASPERLLQQVHSPSNPLTTAENEVDGGRRLHGLQLETRRCHG